MTRLAALLLLTMTMSLSANELPLWPDGPPDGIRLDPEEESIDNRPRADQRLSRGYWHVHQPTITFHPADPARATGAGIVVFPGGGLRYLEMDKEGHDIARWLNRIGIAAVVVKYRTRPVPTPDELWPDVIRANAADGSRAMRLVRHHAEEWGIDPSRLGAMGFSAGGRFCIGLALEGGKGDPDAGDPVDRLSAKPDFIGLIYPSIPDLPDTLEAMPPAFIANASDDPKTRPERAVAFYSAMLASGQSAELHIFRDGDHGFGIHKGGPVRNWATLFEEWMRELDLLHPSREGSK